MDPKFERRKNIIYIIIGLIALVLGLLVCFATAYGTPSTLPPPYIIKSILLGSLSTLLLGAFGGYYIGKVKGYKEIQLTCPECETVNPKGAKFCKNCGKPL